MEGNYPVFYRQQAVGKVQVIKKGLYYSFHCRCRMESGIVCRLVAKMADTWENLGIPVPEGDGLELNRKLPCKRMGEEMPEFLLIPHDEDIDEAIFGSALKAAERGEMASIPSEPKEETVPAERIIQIEPKDNIPEPEKDVPAREKDPQAMHREEICTECSAAEAESAEAVSEGAGDFYPIETDMPFEHLDELGQGVLENRNGQTGVFIPGQAHRADQISSDSPTGQWSEPITSE